MSMLINPPALGSVAPSSAKLNAVKVALRPEITTEITTAGPAIPLAIPAKTNIPAPIMAPSLLRWHQAVQAFS